MKIRRIVMSLCGVLICAVSVGIFKLAALGVDPFQSLMSGLDELIPISFGTLYVIVNLILLTFSLLTDRHNIGIATFINLFLLGYITQFSYALLQKLFPDPGLLFRFICLIIAIIIICFGSALYMTADLGVSTYDSVAIVLSSKWKIANFSFAASPQTVSVSQPESSSIWRAAEAFPLSPQSSASARSSQPFLWDR